MFRLLCTSADHVAEGIETATGWNMVAFDRHVQSCPVCSCSVGKIRRRIEDALRKGRPSKILEVANGIGVKIVE